jgi:hypothetical protein
VISLESPEAVAAYLVVESKQNCLDIQLLTQNLSLHGSLFVRSALNVHGLSLNRSSETRSW